MVLDPFGLLGVNCNSTLQEVRKKYYALASMCHPDRGGADEDMRVVHNAYCFVRDQVALNRQCTYEQMRMEFEDFCAGQTSVPPRFVDIHHETFGQFGAAFEASTHIERAFAEGGVETVESEVRLEYSNVEHGNVQQFTRDIVVHAAPDPFDAGGFLRSVDGTHIKDYSCVVGCLHVSDYREGLAPPEVVQCDETLEQDVLTSFEERNMLYAKNP